MRAGLLCFRSARWIRDIKFLNLEKPVEGLPTKPPKAKTPFKDPISHTLAAPIQGVLNSDPDTDGAEPNSESENGHAERLYEHYVLDAVHMRNAHSRRRARRYLREEEGMLGTIPANCAQSWWRSDWT
jgi:hypothetical protein